MHKRKGKGPGSDAYQAETKRSRSLVKKKRCCKGFVVDGGSAVLRQTGTGAPGSDDNEDLVQGGSMSDGHIT
jgi:hypothetical protein